MPHQPAVRPAARLIRHQSKLLSDSRRAGKSHLSLLAGSLHKTLGGISDMKPYFAFQWHITDECDQRCRHCYIFSEDNQICLKQMRYEEMETVLSSCMDLCERLGRTPYFYITGGDPILHKDFWRLCGLLEKNHITFGILGNPFHLTDDVCKRLYA